MGLWKRLRKYNVMKSYQKEKTGFTLVEILVVVVVLALAMWAAVPMFSGAASIQVQSAANMIAADLEYAKSMAISRQRQYGISFNPGVETYSVIDQNGVVIPHPVKTGFLYTIDFHNDSRLNQVDLASVNFDGNNLIKFDYLGSPLKSDGSPLNSGTVTLQGGGITITITVEPVTGYIRIQ
jgi:prepilin-type N-terminal cleavage/methylation domain-containing protein